MNFIMLFHLRFVPYFLNDDSANLNNLTGMLLSLLLLKVEMWFKVVSKEIVPLLLRGVCHAIYLSLKTHNNVSKRGEN